MKNLFFISSFIFSACAQSIEPFEDIKELVELSDEELQELHEKHKGDMLYGDTEFGFIVNQGNTESTAFKLKANLYQDLKKWRNQFKVDALYRKERDQDTTLTQVSAARYYVSAQANYKIGGDNESLYLYGDHTNDRFSGKAYTSTLSVGYGMRVYEGTKNTLDIDFGPGFNLSKTDDKIELIDAPRLQRGHLLRLALQWERTISERTRFNHDMSIEYSLSGLNHRVLSETAIISQVLGSVALKFSYIYRFNSQPEENKEKVDTELGATLVYSF